MVRGNCLVSVAFEDRLFQVHYKRARRAISQCGRLTNINNSPEHGPIFRGMISFRCALGFAETPHHYHRLGCGSMLHRRE